jgi:dCTP deaminase
MTIKSDIWIKEQVQKNQMITPFFDHSVKTKEDGKKIPSYGLSSYGYDIRLGRNFKLGRTNLHGETILDVCDFDQAYFEDITDVDSVIIPPHGFVLGHSEEYFNIPRNVTAVCMGKSTIARSGLIVIVTPLESAWSGFVTLEIFNANNLPVRLHSGIGITQAQFFESDQQCEVSYADRGGKYQFQAKLPIAPRN